MEMQDEFYSMVLISEIVSIVFTVLKVITWIVFLYIAIKIANKYLKK